MRKKVRNTKGITLIALIITIIILLILAIVTIRILMNQGIIHHAENATDAYNNAQNNETEYLAYAESEMDKYAGGSSTNADLELLQRYCLGDNKEGLDLLTYVLDANTMKFIDREPIANASTTLIYTDMAEGKVDGEYLIYIYFTYNEISYELVSTVDMNTYEYTTKTVRQTGGIKLSENEIILLADSDNNVGETKSITATLEGAANGTVTWDVEDRSIATINNNTGDTIQITAVAKGTTKITATCGDYSNTCVVTVEEGFKYGDKFLKVGDYVAYDATKDANRNTVSTTSYTSYGQTFNVSDYTSGWRVLSVKNGKIQLVSASSVGELHLSGQVGYVCGTDELNAISSIYGQGNGATGADSIDIDDINAITGYNPLHTGDGNPYGNGAINQYGNDVTFYWQGTEYPYYEGSNGVTGDLVNKHYGFNWYDGSAWQKSTKSTTATTKVKERITTIKSTGYQYAATTLTETGRGDVKGIANTSNEYKLLFGESYWLASKCVMDYTTHVYFAHRTVDGSRVSYSVNYDSYGSDYNTSAGVRPVVTLSSSVQIKTDGTQDGSTQDKAYTIE